MLTPIKIGISSCLLGNLVRYDGGHSHDRFLTQTLGLFTEYVPVCPEVECGMSTPRDSLRLVGDPENPRLVTRKTGEDHTAKMHQWIQKKLPALEKENLCGFIFKSKSPSSGLYRIKVYGDDNKVKNNGVGLFARAFIRHFPRIPVEEAGRLNDPKLREHFIENIFSFQRWRNFLENLPTLGKLVAFHTENKLLILSHSQDMYRQMGKLVARGKDLPPSELFEAYEQLLIKSLDLKTTPKKNINVLQHAMGFFKTDLTGDEKQELLTSFSHYRDGYVPLIVPLTLIKHYVLKYDQPWLKSQTFLNPHPFELKLRNYF
ncbi:MAG: YbgA family protein [Desulfotignum sp.]